MKLNRVRFEDYELNLDTGELLKSGERVKLQGKPAQLLKLLVTNPGQLVTREHIQRELWRDGEFVEFEHGVNTAIRRIRVALDDNAETPRMIETLPRQGYRFIAIAEIVELPEDSTLSKSEITDPDVLPISVNASRFLFLLAQVPYIITYLVFFYQWYDLDTAIGRVLPLELMDVSRILLQMISLAGFAVRIYLIALVGWGHADAGARYRTLFPYLLPLDAIWAITPLLVQPTVGPLISWVSLILMLWLIFGQRNLMHTLEHLQRS